MNLEDLVTTSQAAEMFNTTPEVLRREAKAGNVPGASKILQRWGFNPKIMREAGWTPPRENKPEPKSRVNNKTGEVERVVTVWATDKQLRQIEQLGIEVISGKPKSPPKKDLFS